MSCQYTRLSINITIHPSSRKECNSVESPAPSPTTVRRPTVIDSVNIWMRSDASVCSNIQHGDRLKSATFRYRVCEMPVTACLALNLQCTTKVFESLYLWIAKGDWQYQPSSERNDKKADSVDAHTSTHTRYHKQTKSMVLKYANSRVFPAYFPNINQQQCGRLDHTMKERRIVVQYHYSKWHTTRLFVS